jgi:hypothetical protein|tara:strand:+ start:327 stop:554 length:228 start_codon:yes stop_codon:yes gene_type:complete
MKLTPIASNQNVVTVNNGTEVFFSYSTPVAAFVPSRGYLRTEVKYSVTTSRHINKWVGEANCETITQDEINNLVD